MLIIKIAFYEVTQKTLSESTPLSQQMTDKQFRKFIADMESRYSVDLSDIKANITPMCLQEILVERDTDN